MNLLPIDAYLPSVLEGLEEKKAVVVVAEPGAGKTTRVAPALLGGGVLPESSRGVLLLQPRRVAARASASRIASEMGVELGTDVGYVTRSDRRVGPRTRLRVITEGILTRLLLADPFLEGIGAVVLDEFHERSIHTDLAIALLREVRESVRPDLRVVVMSATLDAEPISEFLGGCPIVRVPGRRFPVEIEYLGRGTGRSIAERAAQAVGHVLTVLKEDEAGDLLVFLPGREEIYRTSRLMEPVAARENRLVLPLHGSMSAAGQDRVFAAAEVRRIILATNIAETSLTIEGIRTVVDTGLARMAVYDAGRGLDRLELGRISKASASQRAGRAGRTAPGRCFRLWEERETRGLREYDEPEIRRVDLSSTLLVLHAWGESDPYRFPWFEAPSGSQIEAAEAFLRQIGALTESGGRLTPLGQRLVRLPVHPRLGRLLIEASDRGLVREGATLAALLSEKDILVSDSGPGLSPGGGTHAQGSRSDLLFRMDLLNDVERRKDERMLIQMGLDSRSVRQVVRVRDDLVRVCKKVGGKGERCPAEGGVEETLLRCLLVAYPDRVAVRRGSDPRRGTVVGGRGVRLDGGSVLRSPGIFLAHDVTEDRRGSAGEARVRLASEIERDWLLSEFPGEIRKETLIRFDEGRRCVVGVEVLRYRDLILREEISQGVDGEAAGLVLAEALGRDPLAFVCQDEKAASWLDRLNFLRRAMPERLWPELDQESLHLIVREACQGKRSEDEVRRVPLVPLLRRLLTFEQERVLQEEAPEAMRVPSGNLIEISYSGQGPPVLAVRIQELFGLMETPRVAAGRVPVLLHLLGPNYRPVQITQDLKSFWSTTYFQVRKDLRARYPKHSWPEDPRTAFPEAKGGRRRPSS